MITERLMCKLNFVILVLLATERSKVKVSCRQQQVQEFSGCLTFCLTPTVDLGAQRHSRVEAVFVGIS